MKNNNRSPKKPIQSGLHPRNKHHGRYNIEALVKALPALKSKVTLNPKGKKTIDFSNADAVLMLNKALLSHHYQVRNWDIPKGYLCPPIPGRADYVHRLADLLNDTDDSINVLDIGTGASCIYPIIGATDYQWHFTASDIDPVSIKVATEIVTNNAHLKGKISPRLQKHADSIFKGIIQQGEYYHLTMCNPPFHKSLKDAELGTKRKTDNLAKNRAKRGSQPMNKAPVSATTKSTKLNFGGQKAELWCPGGEEAFIKKMARESADFKQQVGWFSTLISKKENVFPMKKTLQSLKATEIKVVEMSQGQKVSRFIAWRFN
ncbi:23S rRNA (adenine(1618)-N(6))-methyltransferase [Vibrio sp. UCD-FRSSP16_10]|uniref:23S rRNA (adenine(1618)-N(6))-methyltransferase RlmF n=1 Tax=unclassified Vibrio TaxID=2614977 RepID=UPI0007FE658D|nr:MULTISPECIES: 23S rRNA (adenine(1618)-N(6))-methyltransferase RlmF [unclassified Vibrio]OBT08635.1 23S rRNA (adenine(1618)-N(6))-methyltransferase [Vibrio sp. UCD-FRSSP16_30]OBT18165.1 23S rRNA (adenine(1618)-N(6))-methyltransferase [Vibrio sp. UCD-FRSSP16_10]